MQRLSVMARRRDRHRLLSPLGELEQCTVDRNLDPQAATQARLGQHFQRDFSDHAKTAEAAGHQP